jgi:hypothetical protein
MCRINVITGYWQAEKYFSKIAEQIREDFSFKPTIGSKDAILIDQINKVNAVSLHVRRGDYVNNPATATTHGLCSLDYYRKAINYLAQRELQPHFFVFSDDINWVKSNLEINFPCQYVDHNRGAESFNDMRLMSLCNHNIIANSSFSWWGAWLNQRVDKIVIAPNQWFADGKVNTMDLRPKSWICL